MADLSANRNLRFWDLNRLQTLKYDLDNSAAQHIYRGQPMMIDQDVDTTHAVGFDSTVTETTGDVFLGIALEEVEIATTDAEGTKEVEVARRGIVGFPNSYSFTDADTEKLVYFSDSGTLTTTSTSNLGPIGRIFAVEDSYVYIELYPGAAAGTQA